ncbi:MAG: ATP-binding protein [Patescibacteria group bacterium]
MKPHVITGGPGVGKTTVLELLSAYKYATVPETARAVIEEETIKDSDMLSWKNLVKFQEEVAKRQLQAEQSTRSKITFLDRSLIDGYAYCALGKVQPPEIILQHGRSRYGKVFLLEPLDVYVTDRARAEDRELAYVIHNEISKSYSFFGYDLIKVPVFLPEKRVEFIIGHLTEDK